jgi:hypothetical protein
LAEGISLWTVASVGGVWIALISWRTAGRLLAPGSSVDGFILRVWSNSKPTNFCISRRGMKHRRFHYSTPFENHESCGVYIQVNRDRFFAGPGAAFPIALESRIESSAMPVPRSFR